jgi:dCMP deaminase
MKDEFGRPDWDTWFISRAFLIARRSIDPRTKHGCIVVDDDRNPLSCGYNGPPCGCVDSEVPLEAPDKYDWMKHAENNAISNAAKKGVSLKNSTFYITGHPCYVCFMDIVNVKAKRIIYGSQGSVMVKEKDLKLIDQVMNNPIHFGIAKKPRIEFIKFNDMDSVKELAKECSDFLQTLED